MNGLDASIFRAINTGWANTALDPVMLALTTLGTGAAQAAIGLLLITIGWWADWANTRRAGYAGLIAWAVSTIVVQLGKELWNRPRPVLVLHDVRMVCDPLFSNSFPSGHTSAAFAVAVACSMFIPRLAFILIPLAIAVGISRVYVGAHFPLDVAFGAVLGTIIGLAAARIVRTHRSNRKASPEAD